MQTFHKTYQLDCLENLLSLVLQADGNFDYLSNKVHKSISPQLSQQRHNRLVHQRSTPISIGRNKFQAPRQPEERMLRQAKPLLQRGTGFGSNSNSSDAGGTSSSHHPRFESGTRESSLGERYGWWLWEDKVGGCNKLGMESCGNLIVGGCGCFNQNYSFTCASTNDAQVELNHANSSRFKDE